MPRLGFMAGQIAVPDDFDTMGSSAIEQLFAGVARSSYWTLTFFFGPRENPAGSRPMLAD
jgi:hypothetical protein